MAGEDILGAFVFAFSLGIGVSAFLFDKYITNAQPDRPFETGKFIRYDYDFPMYSTDNDKK